MTYKKKISQIVAIAIILLSLGTHALAAYNDVVFADNTLINLSALGINITVSSGAQVAGYTVNTGSIDFSMQSGSTVTLLSPDFRGLNNTINAVTVCSSGYSSVVLTSSTTQTITVTPTATNICSGGGSGGSGGGTLPVGGGSFYNPSTAQPAPTPSSGSSASPDTTTHAHANGTLILDGSTIYIIKDGQRYGFRNPEEYKSHGYKFNQAVKANVADKALPLGGVIKSLVGTLVLDAKDGKTVYIIGENNTRLGFASGEVYKNLGYSYGGLLTFDVADYTAGEPIHDANSIHPEGALVKDDEGTVWWIIGGKKLGFESLAVFNTYGFPLTRIVKANTADLALSDGPLVKFRDGTLVKDGTDYFLISDGKKLKFGSLSDLTAKGYNQENVILGSLVAYALGN